MSDAIEVLKDIIKTNIISTKEERNALDEALLALEKKEDDRKQSALAELKKQLKLIRNREKEITNCKSYSNNQKMLKQVETQRILNQMRKRIKELEEGSVKD